LAAAMALRSRVLLFGSPPPMRAASTISLVTLVKTLPRLASCAPLRIWMLCHLL
jgi:hypothetical protein